MYVCSASNGYDDCRTSKHDHDHDNCYAHYHNYQYDHDHYHDHDHDYYYAHDRGGGYKRFFVGLQLR